MKQTTNKARQLRKLIVHRESIAALTLPQLGNVAGGDAASLGPGCVTISRTELECLPGTV